MDSINLQVNEYQTQLTEELLATLSLEVKDELFDAINTIPFIANAVNPNRKRAKDLDRDDLGRIIVDVCNPHICEDMEYFRPVGNYFRKHGVITHLRPNSNPNSEYGRWIKEELRRIWYGYVRESDGEWVTGEMYFYINYSPIMQTKLSGSGKGKRANRVIDLPEIWEVTYLWFHYIEQAKNGGLYDPRGGKHCVHIARRGVGKSFTSAALLARIFITGDNKEACNNLRGLVTAYTKEFLTKDGILNKFMDTIDFCKEHTLFPSNRLKSSLLDMAWRMGYFDLDLQINKGTLNEVIGISSKDDADKMRGKRATVIIFEEFGAFNKFLDVWNTTIPSVLEGDISFGVMIALGTGGTPGSKFDGALEIDTIVSVYRNIY